MKKFVLTLLVLVFCSMGSTVFATTQVSYNVAGAVSTIKHGPSHTTTFANNFGTNAAFSPHSIALASQRHRAMRRATMANEYNYRNNNHGGRLSSNGNSPAQVAPASRFNKSYTVSSQKSYTKNGVTYYN
jgi:hypothetical protein